MWLYSEMNFIISPGVNDKFLLNYQLYYLLRRQYYLQNKVYKRKKKKKQWPFYCVCAQSCLTLCDPMDCSLSGSFGHQAPLSMGLFRQEYWSGLPFPYPGYLHNPSIECVSPVSPELQADSFPVEPSGKAFFFLKNPFLGLPWWLKW